MAGGQAKVWPVGACGGSRRRVHCLAGFKTLGLEKAKNWFGTVGSEIRFGNEGSATKVRKFRFGNGGSEIEVRK